MTLRRLRGLIMGWPAEFWKSEGKRNGAAFPVKERPEPAIRETRPLQSKRRGPYSVPMNVNLDDYLPNFLLGLRKHTRRIFPSDLLAGVTVSLVALPLPYSRPISLRGNRQN
jgi:hypothetical protein